MSLKIEVIILGLCCIQGLQSNKITLNPTEVYVDVNKSLTFTCTYIGYDEVFGTRLSINNEPPSPYIVRSQDGTCTGIGIFANDRNYRVGCPSESSFTVTILRVQLGDHNVLWRCFDRDRSSNTVFKRNKVTDVQVKLKKSEKKLLSRKSVKSNVNISGIRIGCDTRLSDKDFPIIFRPGFTEGTGTTGQATTKNAYISLLHVILPTLTFLDPGLTLFVPC